MYVPEAFASTMEFLAIDYHFSNIARGVIDSRNIHLLRLAARFLAPTWRRFPLNDGSGERAMKKTSAKTQTLLRLGIVLAS